MFNVGIVSYVNKTILKNNFLIATQLYCNIQELDNHHARPIGGACETQSLNLPPHYELGEGEQEGHPQLLMVVILSLSYLSISRQWLLSLCLLWPRKWKLCLVQLWSQLQLMFKFPKRCACKERKWSHVRKKDYSHQNTCAGRMSEFTLDDYANNTKVETVPFVLF